MTAKITKHGERRARKRMGIPKKAVQRDIERALTYGYREGDFSGELGMYVNILVQKTDMKGKEPLIVVHANNAYIFADEDPPVLITTYPLPNKYRTRHTVRPYREAEETQEDETSEG